MTTTPESKPDTPDLEHMRQEYNAAIANGLILKARRIGWRMDAVDTSCQHDDEEGDEGPVVSLGRMPTRWRCRECGAIRDEQS